MEENKKPRKKYIRKNIDKNDLKITPAYKLKEFWNYKINPITGFTCVREAQKESGGIKKHWIEKNINKTQ